MVCLSLGGFPIALIFGWAFDFGPGGIQVAPEPPPGEECPPAYRGRRRNLFTPGTIGLTISAVVGYFIFRLQLCAAAR
ncbi:MAG: hypothetical protein H0W43_06970 [Chthoniobacterales bacterium]|nr:hypothetical protein [Chthoniobacterales bacterium]